MPRFFLFEASAKCWLNVRRREPPANASASHGRKGSRGHGQLILCVVARQRYWFTTPASRKSSSTMSKTCRAMTWPHSTTGYSTTWTDTTANAPTTDSTTSRPAGYLQKVGPICPCVVAPYTRMTNGDPEWNTRSNTGGPIHAHDELCLHVAFHVSIWWPHTRA